jgi:hypothetical protein
MKLCLGPPPDVADFSPEDEGWTALREPSPGWVNLLAAPCGVFAVAVLALAWGRGPSWSASGGPLVFGPLAPLVWMVLAFGLCFVGTVIVHECLHALAYPGFGLTDRTLIGAWPSRLLFYAAHLDALSRNRWLLVYLLPLIVLSVLPLLAWRVCGLYSGLLHFVSLLNGLASSGDLLMVLLMLLQVPRRAKLRNKGWCSWWRINETESRG